MNRGTTPVCRFKTDLDLSTAEVIYVTFQQVDKRLYKTVKENLIEKTKADLVELTEDHIAFGLSQEDTLKLHDCPDKVRIQIRARWASGGAAASNIMVTSVEEILKEGVI